MARGPVPSRRDSWGRRSRDPFHVWLRGDPRRAAVLSTALTVGLIIFWLMVVVGLIVFFIVALV